MYWETQYGRSLVESDQINEIRLLYRRVHILQEQYAKAREIVTSLRRLQTDTANEAFFDELQDLSCQLPNTWGFDSPLAGTAPQNANAA